MHASEIVLEPVSTTEAPAPLVLNEPAEVNVPVANRVRMQQVTDTIPPPLPEHYDIWLLMVVCEAGGNWQINTGNGYYGGLQFTLTSWRGADGLQYASRPDLATPLEQMFTAEELLDMQGWRAWPACSRKLGLR